MCKVKVYFNLELNNVTKLMFEGKQKIIMKNS